MKRPHRSEDGHYHIQGKKYPQLFGSRQQVMNGTAYKTSGELTKSHLMMNKWGRIVSRKKHATAKKEKRLLKHGYSAKKGKFGYVKVSTKKRRTMRGGQETGTTTTPPNGATGQQPANPTTGTPEQQSKTIPNPLIKLQPLTSITG